MTLQKACKMMNVINDVIAWVKVTVKSSSFTILKSLCKSASASGVWYSTSCAARQINGKTMLTCAHDVLKGKALLWRGWRGRKHMKWNSFKMFWWLHTLLTSVWYVDTLSSWPVQACQVWRQDSSTWVSLSQQCKQWPRSWEMKTVQKLRSLIIMVRKELSSVKRLEESSPWGTAFVGG